MKGNGTALARASKLTFRYNKKKCAWFDFLSFYNICMHLRVSFDRALVYRKTNERTNGNKTAKFWTEKCAHFYEKIKIRNHMITRESIYFDFANTIFRQCEHCTAHTRARPVIAIIISQRENNSIAFFRKQKLRFVCVLFLLSELFFDLDSVLNSVTANEFKPTQFCC